MKENKDALCAAMFVNAVVTAEKKMLSDSFFLSRQCV